jgi:hypothetical protein
MARERMPFYDWTGTGWETLGWIEKGELFDASDHWLPHGELVLLLADGRGYVTETAAERPAPELHAYNVGPVQ